MFENGDKSLSRNYAKVKSFGATTDGSSMCSELQDILKKRKKKVGRSHWRDKKAGINYHHHVCARVPLSFSLECNSKLFRFENLYQPRRTRIELNSQALPGFPIDESRGYRYRSKIDFPPRNNDRVTPAAPIL